MAQDAEVTVATALVPVDQAARFGIVWADSSFRVRGFEEKPLHPQAENGVPREGLRASMGIYLFSTPVLLDALRQDAKNSGSRHDFGGDILPKLVKQQRVMAYNFDSDAPDAGYWRDVGALDSYYEANMDLVSVSPVFNLYDEDWPIHAAASRLPPAKFVFADEGRRIGVAVDSLVSHGCIVSGGRVTHSVLSPGVRVNSFCEIEHSILLPGVRVGRRSRIRRAILGEGVEVPEDSLIGFDPEADRLAGHVVTKAGVIVVEGVAGENGAVGRAAVNVTYWG
jgi:glucose-1-phosphate adenylyltransferase